MRPISLASTLQRFAAPDRHAKPHQRVRVLAKYDGFDPLSAVRVGDSTLDDFSYASAGLCQDHFHSCALRSSGVA